MRYFIIISLLVVGCQTAHKSVNEIQQKTDNSILSGKDSSGHTTVDSSSVSGISTWGTLSVDSGYDKVTEEMVKETIDSNAIRREITRTIKEKGQKRVEQSSTTIKNDSTGKIVSQQANVTQFQKEDNTAVTSIKQKGIKRASFMPWWLWLIALVLAGLIWWKRNSVFKYFI